MEKLPIKTKIAAWWITTIIAIIVITTLGFSLLFGIELHTVYILAFFSILLFPCFLLFRKKKLGWYWIVIVLSGIIICSSIIVSYILTLAVKGELPKDPVSGIVFAFFFYSSIFFLTVFLIPLILLLLDRKNFWKVAS